MADLVVIVGVVAFFAICAAYIAGCDRIIGPDAAETATDDADRSSLPPVPGTA